jgi:hypothetical protein
MSLWQPARTTCRGGAILQQTNTYVCTVAAPQSRENGAWTGPPAGKLLYLPRQLHCCLHLLMPLLTTFMRAVPRPLHRSELLDRQHAPQSTRRPSNGCTVCGRWQPPVTVHAKASTRAKPASGGRASSLGKGCDSTLRRMAHHNSWLQRRMTVSLELLGIHRSQHAHARKLAAASAAKSRHRGSAHAG